jgi:hypothetical protein
MNLGRISTIQCVNTPPPPDTRCDDLAYALAHPDLCPAEERFIIKPGVSLICELGSVSFRAFTVINGAETDVTSSTIFQSSNGDVALIGATTGNATGTGAGSATITATYQSQTAQAEITVMSGADCCDDLTVAIMVLVDQTRSMSQQFSSSYTKKLVFAKTAATALIESVNEDKDLVGLARFTKEQATVLSPPISDKAAVAALVPQILQTQDDTTFYDALAAAIDSLNATTADRKLLVLISDGEDTTPSYVEFPNPIQLADDFKSAGGIIVALGVRAHGAGYNLLSGISTGGFFVNAFQATEDAALDYVVALKGYLCAGNCTPAGDEVENQGTLAFTDLLKWDISGGGSVDLLGNGFFDYLPGNGLYLDLVGSGTPANPLLITKDSFAVAAGEEYRVVLNMAGNHVFADSLATVQIKVRSQDSADLWIQNILIEDYLSGFHDYLFTFIPPVECMVKIEVQQIASIGFPIPDPDQMSGILVNSVTLSSVTHGTILFSDNFDSENPVYVGPQCGQGTIPQEIGTDTNSLTLFGSGTADVNGEYTKVSETEWTQASGGTNQIIFSEDSGAWEIRDSMASVLYTCAPNDFPVGEWVPVSGDPTAPVGEYATLVGYAYGYNCYGDGCLDTPPVAQLEDPNPLPILEAGNVPPGNFTSTQTGCASCPDGYVNFGPELSGETLESGELGNAEYQTIVRLDTATAVRRYRVTFNRIWNPSGFFPYSTMFFQGSFDRVTWFPLDSTIQRFVIPGLTAAYELPAASDAYLYYRISLGPGFPSADGKVMALSLFGDVEALACAESDGEGSSQSAADNDAIAKAEALANAELNCMFRYTATATYVATCPFGTFGESSSSAVGHSFNSADEARIMAEDAAREAAEDALVCVDEEGNFIAGEDEDDPIGGEGGEPFPD